MTQKQKVHPTRGKLSTLDAADVARAEGEGMVDDCDERASIADESLSAALRGWTRRATTVLSSWRRRARRALAAARAEH